MKLLLPHGAPFATSAFSTVLLRSMPTATGRIMKRSLKACIAYIAGTAILRENNLTLYNCGDDSRLLVSGGIEGGQVDVSVRKNNNKMLRVQGSIDNLVDDQGKYHLSIQLQGNQFEGREHNSGKQFSGKVSDTHIRLKADGYSVYCVDLPC